MTTAADSSHSEGLLDTAFDVVRRYKDFDSYGSEDKAVKAMVRRCPNFSRQECAEAFRQAMELFVVASEVVTGRKDELLAGWQAAHAALGESVDAELQARLPTIPVKLCRSA